MLVKHRELMTMMLLVMAMELVAARQMLKVTSVILVLLVTTTSQLAQVSDVNLGVYMAQKQN